MTTAKEYARTKGDSETWKEFDSQPLPAWLQAYLAMVGCTDIINSDIIPTGEQAEMLDHWAEVAKRDESALLMKKYAQPKGAQNNAAGATNRRAKLLVEYRGLIEDTSLSDSDVAGRILHRLSSKLQNTDKLPKRDTIRKQVGAIRKTLDGSEGKLSKVGKASAP